MGGKEECLVEIDETAVSKRKFNRGRRVSTLWCVGGICRTHKTFFLGLTTVRSKPVLNQIIERNVKKDTKVLTDEWRGYFGLGAKLTPHEKICHKKHHVGPKAPHKHTQNIENLWRWLKKYIKNHETASKKI